MNKFTAAIATLATARQEWLDRLSVIESVIEAAGSTPERIAVRTAAENHISEYNEAIFLLSK